MAAEEGVIGKKEVTLKNLSNAVKLFLIESDLKEWAGVHVTKNARKVLTPEEAAEVRQKHVDRIIGAR